MSPNNFETSIIFLQKLEVDFWNKTKYKTVINFRKARIKIFSPLQVNPRLNLDEYNLLVRIIGSSA